MICVLEFERALECDLAVISMDQITQGLIDHYLLDLELRNCLAQHNPWLQVEYLRLQYFVGQLCLSLLHAGSK